MKPRADGRKVTPRKPLPRTGPPGRPTLPPRGHAPPVATAQTRRPAGPTHGTAVVVTAAAAKETPAASARATLLDSLFKDAGQPGTLLVHPQGHSFTLRADVAEGAVHTQRTLMVPLPGGGRIPHVADLAIEVEGGGLLYVDVLDSHARLNDVKAAAFDGAHLKNQARKPVAVLVFVRLAHPTVTQEHVEAVGHAYDYVFGVDHENVSIGSKFAACRAEILKRLSALAGG